MAIGERCLSDMLIEFNREGVRQMKVQNKHESIAAVENDDKHL